MNKKSPSNLLNMKLFTANAFQRNAVTFNFCPLVGEIYRKMSVNNFFYLLTCIYNPLNGPIRKKKLGQ